MSILSIIDIMEHMSATDAKQTFSLLLEKAQRGPVIITKKDRDVAVMLSMTDYERLRRLNIKEFQDFRREVARKAKARGLTPAILESILADE